MKELEKKAKQILNQMSKFDSNQLVADCLFIAEREEIYFEDNDLLPKVVAEENYLDKSTVQKKILRQEKVLGYTELLNRMRDFKEDNVHIFTIAVIDSTFIVFFNERNDYLIGVLRTYGKTKKDLEMLNIEYKKMGLSVNGISINYSS